MVASSGVKRGADNATGKLQGEENETTIHCDEVVTIERERETFDADTTQVTPSA